MKGKLLVVVTVLALLLLTSCGMEQQEKEIPNVDTSVSDIVVEEAKVNVYSVQFLSDDGSLLYEEDVEEGFFPSELEQENGTSVVWYNEAGDVIDPFTTPVVNNAVYIAKTTYQTVLPFGYFDVKDDTWFDKDAEVTPAELETIVRQTVVSEKKAENICDGIAEGMYVTTAKFLKAFDGIFDDAEMNALLEGVSEHITRNEMASLLYELAGSKQHIVVFEDYPVIPSNIDIQDDLPLICAICDGREDKMTGMPVGNAILGCKWTYGPHLNNGYLYYANSAGNIVKNALVGETLTFGSDGRYTTGHDDVDEICRDTILYLQDQHRDASLFELLHDAFVYVSYDGGTLYISTAEASYGDNDGDWVYSLGYDMLNDLAGDCYGFAAGFGLLARNLGFDARCIAGLFNYGTDTHGWVFIRDEEDGEYRFYDPQTAYRNYYGQRSSHGYECFHDPVYATDSFGLIWESVVDSDDAVTNALRIRGMVGQNIEDVYELYGTPEAFEYSLSAYGDGEDGALQYDGFVVYSYKEGDTETVLDAHVD